jgi:hypothetical protein
MSLDGDRWLVIDHLDSNESHQYTLHWLLNDVPFTENKNSIHLKYESSVYKVQTGLLGGEAKFSTVRADANSTRGWRSRYYGQKNQPFHFCSKRAAWWFRYAPATLFVGTTQPPKPFINLQSLISSL